MDSEKHIYPPVSIIIIAKNCESMIKMCLEAIVAQKYPKDKIEILVIDGGSTDKTKDVAKDFGAICIDGGYPDNQEARRAIGLHYASHEIVAYIDSDNILPSINWMREMVTPFLEDNKIIASQTYKYTYRKSDSLINRYFALFGANDIVAYYLNKADRGKWTDVKWTLKGNVVSQNDLYYTVCFNEDIPTIGCNGFLIKKSVLLKANIEPDYFFHIDVNLDLVRQGFDRYAFVKNDIIHLTGNSLYTAIKKRLVYMMKHHHNMNLNRRYKVFDPNNKKDLKNIVKFSIYSFTIIKPLFDSMVGFIKIHDIAWFINPLMCLCMFLGYSIATIKNLFTK